MALALLPFFRYFRGTPHQLAAIKQLEDEMPAELLSEQSEWFETWKETGITYKTVVPYYHQLDLKNGYRRCFDAAAAMVASLYGVVNDAEEYGEARAEFGDTTFVRAQELALESLGLHAEFRTDGDAAVLESEIMAGRPVLVGWLHRGDLSKNEPPICDERGCGHWSVIVGFNQDSFIMHDPMGTPDMIHGGHDSRSGGRRVEVSRKLFMTRWAVEGASSGWYILVDDEI